MKALLPVLCVLLIGQFGCTPGGGVMPCSRRQNQVPDLPAVVALTQATITVPMTLPLVVVCPEGAPSAERVDVTVLDADNQPVVAEASAPQLGDTYSTSVTLTPRTGGVYSIAAAFEPSIGAVQRQLQVVEDRSAEAAFDVLPAHCDRLDRVGTQLVCSHRGTVEFFRLGRATAAYAATQVAAAGSVVWLLSAQGLTRADLSAETAVVTTSTTVAPMGVVAAAEHRLFVLSGTRLWFADADDTSIVGHWADFEPLTEATSTSGLLAVDGQTVAYGDREQKLCVLSVEPKSRTCTAVAFTVHHASDGVLWTRNGADGSLGLVRIVNHKPSLTVLTGHSSMLVDEGASVLTFRWSQRLVVPRVPSLTLETWAPRSVTGAVGQGVVWFEETTGQSVVFTRN